MTFAEPIAARTWSGRSRATPGSGWIPARPRVRRARGAIMEAAWRQHLHADPPGELAASATTTHRPLRIPFRGWGVRRVSTSFAAAIAVGLLVGSSVFAASRAGGPLYESRLAIESLALPAGVEARVAAQVVHADARLGEAVEAALRHDDPATAAALDAYDRTIDELATADGAAGLTALEAVQFHRTVLLQLAAQTSDGATTGLDRALANSAQVIDRLAAAGTGGNGAAVSTASPRAAAAAPGASMASPRAAVAPGPARTASPRAARVAVGPGTGSNGEPQGGQGGTGGGDHGPGPKATQAPAPAATSAPEPPVKPPGRGARRRPTRTARKPRARRTPPPQPVARRAPPGAPVTPALRSPDEDPMRLTVLGAGPAYTNREGSTAPATSWSRTGPTCCSTSARARFRGSSATWPRRMSTRSSSATSTRTTSSTSCRCATTCATTSSRGAASAWWGRPTSRPGSIRSTTSRGSPPRRCRRRRWAQGPHRIGKLRGHGGPRAAHRREATRSGWRRTPAARASCTAATAAAPTTSCRLVRPGDVLLAEASFGPGPVPQGAQHLDGPAVGRTGDGDAGRPRPARPPPDGPRPGGDDRVLPQRL